MYQYVKRSKQRFHPTANNRKRVESSLISLFLSQSIFLISLLLLASSSFLTRAPRKQKKRHEEKRVNKTFYKNRWKKTLETLVGRNWISHGSLSVTRHSNQIVCSIDSSNDDNRQNEYQPFLTQTEVRRDNGEHESIGCRCAYSTRQKRHLRAAIR